MKIKEDSGFLPPWYMMRYMGKTSEGLVRVSMYVFSSIAMFGPDLEIHVDYDLKKNDINVETVSGLDCVCS